MERLAMTSFKTQLRQAADQHRQQTYPGDLAADVRPNRFRLRTVVGGALLAACLSLACLIVFTAGSDQATPRRMVRLTIDKPAIPSPRIDPPTLSGRMPSVKLPRLRGAELSTHLHLPPLRPMSLRSPMKLNLNKENAS
jgi:hypothetical protein